MGQGEQRLKTQVEQTARARVSNKIITTHRQASEYFVQQGLLHLADKIPIDGKGSVSLSFTLNSFNHTQIQLPENAALNIGGKSISFASICATPYGLNLSQPGEDLASFTIMQHANKISFKGNKPSYLQDFTVTYRDNQAAIRKYVYGLNFLLRLHRKQHPQVYTDPSHKANRTVLKLDMTKMTCRQFRSDCAAYIANDNSIETLTDFLINFCRFYTFPDEYTTYCQQRCEPDMFSCKNHEDCAFGWKKLHGKVPVFDNEAFKAFLRDAINDNDVEETIKIIQFVQGLAGCVHIPSEVLECYDMMVVQLDMLRQMGAVGLGAVELREQAAAMLGHLLEPEDARTDEELLRELERGP